MAVIPLQHGPLDDLSFPLTKNLASRKHSLTNPAKSVTKRPKWSVLAEAADAESDAGPTPPQKSTRYQQSRWKKGAGLRYCCRGRLTR
jgi:hypothetical protein